ncbi:MAG TPA: hypothetical protein VFM71_01925 [Gemmatimonadaceae bacterium]|nr:hypothetical protein [Gemmatimonadaceae bacterium]
MRDELFLSGQPLMIAGVCFLALGYLASVRRERFLVYWTVAWAVLIARFALNMFWNWPFASPVVGEFSAMLRMWFALALLAGAVEVRGRRVHWGWVLALGAAIPPLTNVIDLLVPGLISPVLNLVIMSVIIVLAASQFAGARALPPLERSTAAVAIAAYGILSGALPRLDDTSFAFRTATLASWTAQLLIGVSMIAIYFRSSYEAELRAQEKLGATLTEALRGYVSICMHCKAIRNEQERWQKLESFVAARSSTVFSHGLCDDCATAHYDGA